MPDHDECDPYGEPRPSANSTGDSANDPATVPEAGPPSAATKPALASQDTDVLDPFDAFRARRAQERAQQEPFPQQYVGEPTEAYVYTRVTPPPFASVASVEPTPRRRLRSAVVFGGILALVVGVGAGVWAAAGSSGGSPSPAAAGTPSASAPASPGAKAAKGGRAVTARLTVTSVGSDSFTATSAHGQTLTVRLTPATRFGTAKRPFARSQLVPGAVVVARLRDESGGTVMATVIAAAFETPDGVPSTTGSADGTA